MYDYQKMGKMSKGLNIAFVACVCLYAVFLAVFCVMSLWPAAAAVFIALAVLASFFLYNGALQYVSYNGKYVKHGETEYEWSKVKLTIACIPTGKGVQYRVIFAENFLFGKDVKTTMRKGFWVRANVKNLSVISKLYENKISVVMFGESTDLIRDKKLKKAVEEHNARFFERVNSESDVSKTDA